MATTRQDQWQEALRQDFIARVGAAICLAAQSIYSEAGGTTGHAARAAFATKVALAPTAYLSQFSEILAAQGIDHASTDTQIDNMIASVWNTFAGA